MNYVIGIDVGSTSVRGALVTETGILEKVRIEKITTWNPRQQFYQQSSDEIWSAICTIIKHLILGIQPDSIKGIGFDATSSLAVIDAYGNPVSVNVGDENTQNIILWMDHRAEQETKFINQIKHPVLRNSGGAISVESMIPKLLWLKNNHPECWKSAEYFFLLPDFLTWKATGQDHRSLGCVIGKCNYQCSHGVSQWNEEFFNGIGLGELQNKHWKKIGNKIINPGELCGKLTTKTAAETGLLAGTPVGASLIDSHAGVIGTVGCVAKDISPDFTTRLVMICGTSTCHMTHTRKEIYAPGVWGPYYSAIIPNMWLLSGGQSAAGKLIDHIIDTHPASDSIKIKCQDLHAIQHLNQLLSRMATQRGLKTVDELTKNLHVWPDFHGNRTPLADASILGMILGLSLDTSEENLAILYLATVQALAYSTKLIINTMKEAGHDTIESLILCGGLVKNELYVTTHANAIGLKVVIPKEKESVLLGVALVGASAAGIYPSLQQAMSNMGGSATVETPDPTVSEYHEKKYKVFLEMLNHQLRCKTIMES